MFRALASLLLPADPKRSGVVFEADDRWTFDPRSIDADVVVWGRPPSLSGMSPLTLATSALARERTIAQLRRRPPRPWHLSAIHRWTPSALAQARLRERARAAMLAGALVQLTNGDPAMPVIDAAASSAGGRIPVTDF